ncbi:N-acetyltransferase 10 [Phlyctochytrium bullatum]|nr:N-acetyltransferase 10 [Phlyctochytrium bullatum]
MNQIKKQIARGQREADAEDPFELFISSTSIRYTYYKETEKILGQTFGMCILQDFEALTPNIMARTIETVEGGGLVIILLKTMKSLKQLYTLTMDVHSRYRTEAYTEAVARFNERFLLSLGSCETCLVLDDELNILPISAGKNIKAVPIPVDSDGNPILDDPSPSARELKDLKQSLLETQPLGSLVSVCRTLDQAKALLTFVEAVAEKSLRTTVTVTASRGRGKSAALGIALGAAVAYGYSNIFVTSPSPENLKTLFEFLFKALEALGYEEHLDYDIVQSTNPEFQKAIVRVNIFKQHRQTIQVSEYEAAAIPLPVVKSLLGPYLIFMASTINGYEGTGRSLSLKLIAQLREQSASARAAQQIADNTGEGGGGEKKPLKNSGSAPLSLRVLREIVLEEPIRFKHYWAFITTRDAPAHHLFVLLPPIDKTKAQTLPEPLVVLQICLEGRIARGTALKSLAQGVRSAGDLIPWVVSQQFQDDGFASLSGARIVRVATHPDYINMGYGGWAISKVEEYFEGSIDGIELKEEMDADDKFQMKRISDEDLEQSSLQTDEIRVRDSSSMPPLLLKLSERPPKERLHWLGVSYGLTPQLFKFWRRSGYTPVYVRQTTNELTGEHTCIMVKPLKRGGRALEGILGKRQRIKQEIEAEEVLTDSQWIDEFSWDFRKRFIELLGYQFRAFAPILVLSILESTRTLSSPPIAIKGREDLHRHLTPHDLRRLDSYTQNLLDYHVILDLVPIIARLYFQGLFSGVSGDKRKGFETADIESIHLSPVQSAILLGIGLQRKTIEEVAAELDLPVSQALALFGKVVRKCALYLSAVSDNEPVAAAEISSLDDKEVIMSEKTVGIKEVLSPTNSKKKPLGNEASWDPTVVGLDDDLENAGNEVISEFRKKQKELINGLDLSQYAINATDEDLQNITDFSERSGAVQVRSSTSTKKRRFDTALGAAATLAAQVKGESSGIFDPQAARGKTIKGKKAKVKAALALHDCGLKPCLHDF